MVQSDKLYTATHAIVGFINPNGFLPSPVITVIHPNDSYYAICPDLTRFKINDFKEQGEKHRNFLPNKTMGSISDGEYTYCLTKDNFITGSPAYVFLNLLDNLKQMSPRDDSKEILLEYLVGEDFIRNLSESKLDFKTCVLLSQNFPLLHIILNDRVKRNKEVASRLTIQYVYSKSKCKTVFKKNITRYDNIDDVMLKPRVLNSAVNAIFKAVSGNADRSVLIPQAGEKIAAVLTALLTPNKQLHFP